MLIFTIRIDVIYQMAGIDIASERFILYIIHIRLVGFCGFEIMNGGN